MSHRQFINALLQIDVSDNIPLQAELREIIDANKKERFSTHSKFFNVTKSVFQFTNDSFIAGGPIASTYKIFWENFNQEYTQENLVYDCTELPGPDWKHFRIQYGHLADDKPMKPRKASEMPHMEYQIKLNIPEKVNVVKPLEHLSEQQQLVIDEIEAFMQTPYKSNKLVKIVFLLGPAGTGKTALLQNATDKPVIFLGPTNILINAVSKSTGVRCMTVFGFIMRALGHNFYQYKAIREHISYLSDDVFRDVGIEVKVPLMKSIYELLAGYVDVVYDGIEPEVDERTSKGILKRERKLMTNSVDKQDDETTRPPPTKIKKERDLSEPSTSWQNVKIKQEPLSSDDEKEEAVSKKNDDDIFMKHMGFVYSKTDAEEHQARLDSGLGLEQDYEEAIRNKSKKIIIYLDEVSQMNMGELSLFFEILDSLPFEVLCLVAGDLNQISPLFITKDLDLHVFEEGRDCRTIRFEQQYRMDNKKYSDVINSISHVKEPRRLRITFLENFFERINHEITFNYPLKMARKLIDDSLLRDITHDSPKDEMSFDGMHFPKLAKYLERLEEVKIFEKISPFVLFGFTNLEMHYNMLMIALQVHEKMSRSSMDPSDYKKILQYSPVQVDKGIYNALHDKKLNKINTCLGEMHFFPLIRFMPYKLLVPIKPHFFNLSILYLIHWDTRQCLLYDRNQRRILIIGRCIHSRNLYKTVVYGFPIIPAMATTYHSCQGLTLDTKIAINLSDIDLKEMYVAFSRVRNPNYIYSLLLPSK